MRNIWVPPGNISYRSYKRGTAGGPPQNTFCRSSSTKRESMIYLSEVYNTAAKKQLV